MNIIERAKNICLNPGPEWNVIDEEQTPTAELLTGYVIPLAAIGAIAGFIGGSIVGRTIPFFGTFRTPMFAGIIGAIIAQFRPQGMARALFATALAQALVPMIALIIWKPQTASVEALSGVLVVNAFFVMLFVGSALLFRRASAHLLTRDG